MKRAPKQTFLLPLLVGWSALIIPGVAQEEESRVPAPPAPPQLTPGTTPVQAVPLETGEESASAPQGNAVGTAMQTGPTATGTTPAAPPPPPVAIPVPAAAPALPLGPVASAVQERSGVIEVVRPERIQVYPDDPDSAWWEINPRYAFERAQLEQRPLMLLFTGMWNPQAMSLSEEVFATKSFNEFVKEHLVICYLNYERSHTDNPDALRHIKDKFKVKGFPNVLIFNPNGEVEKGIRGYRSGRPVDYFNRLKAACQPILSSIEAQKSELIRHGYRDWSNYLGKAIFARFVEQDGKMVRLQDTGGRKWLIAINDLAPEDQRLVESFPPVPEIQREDQVEESE